jgi:hypothetical protein
MEAAEMRSVRTTEAAWVGRGRVNKKILSKVEPLNLPALVHQFDRFLLNRTPEYRGCLGTYMLSVLGGLSL